VDATTPTLVSSSDFVLLTALLQTILRIPATQQATHQIASIIANTSLVRYSISLYSWSDSLSPGASDPVYGELSILFLLTLSSIPLVAQQMAVEGVLSSLSSANISQYLRKPGGKGPFSSPARIHSIWTRGFLALCLNLLEHVGPGIAAEVSAFLNSFPTQLARATSDLNPALQPSMREPHAGSVTLALAAEVHSLALLASIVEGIKMAGASIGIVPTEVPSVAIDRARVGDEVAAALRNRRALAERIVPASERDVVSARMAGSGGASSLLENQVWEELEGVGTCFAAAGGG